MLPYIFLLASSFFHALWNSLLKKQVEAKVILFHAVTFATVIGWIIIIALQDFSYGEALNLTILSGVVEGLYFITVSLALSQAPIAVSYSIMRSLSMLMTWLLSYVILKEQLTFLGGVGVISILVGLSLPLMQKRNSSGPNGNTRYFWSYICAFTILGYNFIYNRALQLNISPLLLFSTSLVISLPILFLSLNKSEKTKVLKFDPKNNNYSASILIGSVLLISFTTFLYGLKDSMPAIAITIRNASIPFALIISSFMGEKLKKSDYIVLLFILFGVVMVSVVSLKF